MPFETWRAYFTRLQEYTNPLATRMEKEVTTVRDVNIYGQETLPPVEMWNDGIPHIRTGYDGNKRFAYYDDVKILVGMTEEQIEARHVAKLLIGRTQ
jgi:hypothetical protein